MSNLRIPEYIIDDRFVTALKNDNVAYIHGILAKQQKWVNSYFFFKIDEEARCGIMENHIIFPAKFILTPIGFCLLFNCPACFIYLLQREAKPCKSCFIVDCPVTNPNLRWKVDLYRLHELKPFALTYPHTEVYKILSLGDFNPNARCSAQFRLVTNKEDRYRGEVGRGVWEFAWIFWKPMREMDNLISVTRHFIENGLDTTRSLAHLNISELFKRCFGFKATFLSAHHATRALLFVELMFHHGSHFDKMRISNASHHCVILLWTYFTTIKDREMVKRVEEVGTGFFCLSKRFRHNIRRSNSVPKFFKKLAKFNFQSLACTCIRVIRFHLGSKYFRSRLFQLTSDRDLQNQIQRGFRNQL